MASLQYTFGTNTYSDPADVDVDGNGSADGIYIDFLGDGVKDAVAWDSDGDGVVDTILVDSDHNGVYDTAYYDTGNGRWQNAESIEMQLGHPDNNTEHADPSPTLSYSFGDSTNPTEVYHDTANVDVSGDGVNDGVAIDFLGDGIKDAVAWDSDGDGVVDTILVDDNHDGTFDTAYTDPAGNGHWSEARSIGDNSADATSNTDDDDGPKPGDYTVGSDDDPFAHVVTEGEFTGDGDDH